MPSGSSPRSLPSKLTLTACILALSQGITSSAFCQNTNVKAELKQRLKNKILVIQGWYQDNDLTYDSSGAVIGAPQRGSWSESAVRIRSIKVHRKDFVLTGSRGGFAYDSKVNKFVPRIAEKREVTITVQADPATLTSKNLDTLENAIFAPEAKIDDMPQYWRDFMAHGEQDAKENPADSGKSETIEGLQSNSQPVFRVGNRVSPPRILNHFNPDFSEVARATKSQGTVLVRAVIDDQGVPTQLKIVKALGMGLDDAAVDCVQQWRFAPAKRDDKPVAVRVDIEVSFKLY